MIVMVTRSAAEEAFVKAAIAEGSFGSLDDLVRCAVWNQIRFLGLACPPELFAPAHGRWLDWLDPESAPAERLQLDLFVEDGR